MSQPTSSDQHVRLWLGTYLLGGLRANEHLAVDEHLARCPECRAERDELGEVTAALALLSAQDVQALADEFGVPALDKPVQRAPVQPAPVRGQAGDASVAVAGGWRSAAGRRAQLVLAAAAITVVVGGVGVGVWWRGSDNGPTVANAATPTAPAARATLSVAVTDRPGATTLRAVVVGIAPGAPCQLLAVTGDGRTLVVHQWAAAGGPQTVVGDVPVPADQLAFVSVAGLDGAVLVSIRLVNGTPMPTP